MRKGVLLVMTAATAMLAALPMAAASAATPHVLTIAKVGGVAVKTGQVVQAPLKAGTKATFFSPGTTTGVTCLKALVTNKVVTNPLKPGTAVESLTGQTFTGCTTNLIAGATVKSVKVVGLPYKTTVSDATGFPVTVTKPGGVLKTTIVVSVSGVPITCTYRATKLSGKASNVGSVNTFKNQVFTLLSGSGACPGKGSFSATFGPLKDISVTNHPLVFVN